jgi:CIC family chloride channel protein
MLAIAFATGGSSLLSADTDTIYTLKLRRRGIDIMRGRVPNVMAIVRVGEAIQSVPPPMPHDAPLADAASSMTLADACPDDDYARCRPRERRRRSRLDSIAD